MTINEIPDRVLADMVRNGCYSINTTFDEGTRLLVLAVPYDKDEADTLLEAFEGFREMLAADDWEERNIQVLTVENGKPSVVELTAETLPIGDSEFFDPSDNGNQGS